MYSAHMCTCICVSTYLGYFETNLLRSVWKWICFFRVLEDLEYQGIVRFKSCLFNYYIFLFRTFTFLNDRATFASVWLIPQSPVPECSGNTEGFVLFCLLIGDSLRNSSPFHLSPSFYLFLLALSFPNSVSFQTQWVTQSCFPTSL